MPYDTHASPLPQLPGRQPDAAITTLGQTSFRGRQRRFGLLETDRLRHVWVIGKTGSGKSTLLANLLAQDLARGMGLALLDPHGDLVRQALSLVPRSRTSDVLLLDPADHDYPVAFNVFRQGRQAHPDRALLTSQLITTFRKQWSGFWGPRLEHILRNAILAVAEDPRATLLLVYRFLTDEALRAKLVGRVSDPVVRTFWLREFSGYSGSLQAEATAPVLNKLGAFVSSPVVRNIVGQVRSRIDVSKVMDDSGVLLANLATGHIGEDAAHLLGGLLLSAIQLGAASRQRGGPPFIVYVDEFQHFVNDSLATMLAESRKFGVGLVLAHQYLGQLPAGLADAIRGNVGSIVAFRLGAHDARVLEDEFSPPFTAGELSGLGSYQMAIRLLARGRQLEAFSAQSLPGPSERPGIDRRLRAIRDQSRARYCRERRGVESAIAAALTD